MSGLAFNCSRDAMISDHVDASNSVVMNENDPLLDGVFEGNVVKVKRDLTRGLTVDSVCSKHRFTPLHIAVHRNYVDLVRFLLDSGANVDATDAWFKTPLHHVASDSSQIANALIAAGANVNAVAMSGRTPIWEASGAGYVSVVRVLIENGAIVNMGDNEGMTPVCAAAAWGHEDVVRFLISSGADVNKRGVFSDPTLCKAVGRGNFAIVSMLIDAGADVCEKNYFGEIPLHFALASGSIEIVKLLIERGADVETRESRNGITPLMQAVRVTNESVDIVKFLIDCGADVNARSDDGYVPLQQTSRVDVASILIHSGADVSVLDQSCQPLLLFHINSMYHKILRMLLEMGRSGDVISVDGMSALLQAAEEGFKDTVCLLLEYGVDVFVRDKYGRTALQLAAYNGHLHVADCIRKWQKQGTNCAVRFRRKDYFHKRCITTSSAASNTVVTTDSDAATGIHSAYEQLLGIRNTPLHEAQTGREVETLLGEGFDIDAENLFGSRPIHCAARRGHLECVAQLVKHGACVNVTDCWGNTPLHDAATSDVHVVAVLLQNKAAINAQNVFGKTPLHYAMEDDNADVVECLLKHGADAGLTDHWTNTALHYASLAIVKSRFLRRLMVKSSALSSAVGKRNFLATSAADHHPSAWPMPALPSPRGRRNGEVFRDILGNTELHRAVGVYRDAKIYPVDRNISCVVDRLVTRQPNLIAEKNFTGHTPLHVAHGRSAFLQCCRQVDRKFFARTDDRGRNFWHKLYHSGQGWNAEDGDVDMMRSKGYASETMFRAKDRFGRLALHYSAMERRSSRFTDYIESFSDLADEQDILARTPFHYAMLAMIDRMDHLASHVMPDMFGKSVADYHSMATQYKSRRNRCRKHCFKWSNRVVQDFREIARRSGATGTLPVDVVSSCRRAPDGSDIDAVSFVWNIWEKSQFHYDKQFDVSVRKTIFELVDSVISALLNIIASMDECFRCTYLRAGSSFEKTKVDELDEFDFMAVLDRLSDVCEVVDDATSPTGYYCLRLKHSPRTRRAASSMKYFDESGFLDTRLVKLRFEALLKLACEEYQRESGETIALLNRDEYDFSPLNVGTKVQIKLMTHLVPHRDLKAHLMHSISVDIVPSMYIGNWRPTDVRSIDPSIETKGSYFIFDQPQRKCPWVRWSPSHVRIDFSATESAFLRRAAPVVRAAFIVVKQMVKNFCDYAFFKSFVLKSAVLHCIRDEIAAANTCTAGNSSDDVNGENLLHWTRSVMRRLLQFFLQDFVPCAFMTSFVMPVCSFEPHLKFMHTRLHQYALTYGDLVNADFLDTTRDGQFTDSRLLMILKAYVCCHLMYYCLLPSDANFELKLPAVNPLKENPYFETIA